MAIKWWNCGCEIALEDREALTSDMVEFMYCRECERLIDEIEVGYYEILREVRE